VSIFEGASANLRARSPSADAPAIPPWAPPDIVDPPCVYQYYDGWLIYPRDRVFALPAGSRKLEESSRVAVPATLFNLWALHRQNLVTPPPTELFHYDWPHGPGLTAPYAAQVVTTNVLILNAGHCYVLNEMRTGKTMAALWAADFLMQHAPARERIRALIVTSLSTVYDVWKVACVSHLLGRRTAVVLPPGKSRIANLDADADFYITNHDALREGIAFDYGRGNPKEIKGLARALIERSDIDIVIIDEASVFKDSTTRRSRAARYIFSQKRFRWALTGSPAPQCPTNVHGLRKLLEPEYKVPLTVLKDMLLKPAYGFRREPYEGAYEKAAEMLRPAVRFRAAECFDIPQQQPPIMRSVAVTPAQDKALRTIKHDAALLLQSGKILDIANAAVLRSKALQILSGFVYDNDHDAHPLDATPRYAALDAILSDTDEKIIILSSFRAALQHIHKHIGPERALFVDGGTSTKERTRIWDAINNDPQYRYLVAQPDVLKFGLDLTGASLIVWFGATDKTEVWTQANARIAGPRQKRPTGVICLTAHAFETEIFKRLQTKKRMEDALLRLVETPTG